ncbi:T9SS type A sorting domain-containing protein [Bacteroidota bacterium]
MTFKKCKNLELSFVIVKVYDVLGREVATLVNEEKLLGNYEVEFDGIGLSSGIYFYQLKAGNYLETKKMVLLR